MTDTYSLDELAALVELPKRTVRYYIQLALVDRPDGIAKGARYGPRHLERLLQIRKWQHAGLSLERIRELIEAPDEDSIPPRPRGRGSVEVWSRLVVDDGVEVSIEPGRAGLGPEAVRELFRRVMAAYDDIRKEKNDD